jgi:xylan 1,4-beta-xylosidase
VPNPNLPRQPPPRQPTSYDFSYVDEFDGNAVSPFWIGIRTPRKPLYSLEGGSLILHSSAPLGDVKGVPAFIGRRQQHHIATVGLRLTARPEKDGDRAGLAAIQNDNAWWFFGVTRIDGKPVVALIARQNSSEEKLIASAPFAGDSATFTASIDRGTAAFVYRVGDETETLKADFDVTFLSTRKAGGFVGTVIGPYAFSP